MELWKFKRRHGNVSTPVRRNVAKTHLSTGTGIPGGVNQDFYISQLIRHLEDLDLSRSVRAQRTFTSNSSIYLSCCSPSESTSVRSRPEVAPFRMIHRHPTVGVHHVSGRLRSPTEPGRGGGLGDSPREPRLRVTPIQGSRVGPEDTRQGGDARTWGCWGPVEHGRRPQGLKPIGRSTRGDSSTDDSDLSDQEKGGIEVHGWAVPTAELRLRPEPQDVGEPVLPGAQVQSQYEEVLPAPLNGLDQPVAANWAGEPSLVAMVTRLAQMAALQSATVQRELTRTARCRLATTASLTRSSPRPRKADLLDCKWDSAPSGRYGTVVSSLMKLSLTRDLCARRSGPAGALYKQNSARVGTRPQMVFKRSCSSPTKLNRTEAQGQSPGNGSAPTSRAGNKTKKNKSNKKGTFSSRRKPPPNSAKKNKSNDLGKT